MLASAYDMQDYVQLAASSAYASSSSACHLAMLEGAVSSALSHPHIVQTFDWQPSDGSSPALYASACRVRPARLLRRCSCALAGMPDVVGHAGDPHCHGVVRCRVAV